MISCRGGGFMGYDRGFSVKDMFVRVANGDDLKCVKCKDNIEKDSLYTVKIGFCDGGGHMHRYYCSDCLTIKLSSILKNGMLAEVKDLGIYKVFSNPYGGLDILINEREEYLFANEANIIKLYKPKDISKSMSWDLNNFKLIWKECEY